MACGGQMQLNIKLTNNDDRILYLRKAMFRLIII